MEGRERLTVVVADGHTATRGAIRQVLTADGFEVVGEASDADAAVRQSIARQPHLCLLDVDLPGGGVGAASRVVASLPRTTVVMVADSAGDEDLFDAIRAGARGFLRTTMNPNRLGPALRGAMSGEAAVPRTLVAHVLDELRATSRRKVFIDDTGPAELTNREWEVMNLLRHGLSTEEVSRRLFIAPATVRVHVSGALKKLHASDRAAAVRLIVKAAEIGEQGGDVSGG